MQCVSCYTGLKPRVLCEQSTGACVFKEPVTKEQSGELVGCVFKDNFSINNVREVLLSPCSLYANADSFEGCSTWMGFDNCLYRDYKRNALSSGSLEYRFGNMRQCDYPVHKLKLAFYLHVTDLCQSTFKWVEVFPYAKDLHIKSAYSVCCILSHPYQSTCHQDANSWLQVCDIWEYPF